MFETDIIDADIQTSVTILGYLVFLEYSVDQNDSIEWHLNAGHYGHLEDSTVKCLDTLLRLHYGRHILNELRLDFRGKAYEHEQVMNAKLDASQEKELDEVF